MIKHFVRYQSPALIWAAIIFYVSSLPAHKLPKFALLISDKVIHAAIFLVLGLLVYHALEPRVKVNIFGWRRLLFAMVVVVVYGFIDEFHQSFVPGRKIDIMDATADAIGGVIAGAIIYIFASWKRKSV